MTIRVPQVLTELNIDEWVLNGEPTNETEFNQMFRKVIGENDQGEGITSDDTSLFGVTWAQISAKKTELETNEDINELRRIRNKKLAETDWWVLPDRTATTEQTAYRQALRDITDTYSSLDTVVWPTKP